MSYLLPLEATAEHSSAGLTPYVVAAIFVALFVLAGVITHSFKDVANRHSHKTGDQQPEPSAHQ